MERIYLGKLYIIKKISNHVNNPLLNSLKYSMKMDTNGNKMAIGRQLFVRTHVRYIFQIQLKRKS